MKLLIALGLIALVNVGNCIRLDGFRVKHAWSGALKDRENFFDIPRNVKDADAAGFKEVARPIEHGLDVTMRCLEGDVRVCPLYDKAGFVAGLQIAIPVKDLEGVPYEVSKKMILKNILGESYYTTTHYIVSADTIRGGGRQGPIDETIEGIWVQNGNTLMQIPLGEAELSTQTLFKKQNCIPNMGTHYYYNMSAELDCHEVFPYFVLVKEGRAIGLGWQVMGKTQEHGRPWFEEPPARGVEMTIPSAPACLQDWAKTYGVISLHMYYMEEPWKVRCQDGDSLQPMSVVNKLLLTSSRYATKVVDEAKKLLG